MCGNFRSTSDLRRFHTVPRNRMILVPLEAKKARAKALKKVFNVLSTVDKTLEESFREFMPHLNPIERKRMIALIQEVDSFKFECKGRMVSLKEKIEAEEE